MVFRIIPLFIIIPNNNIILYTIIAFTICQPLANLIIRKIII